MPIVVEGNEIPDSVEQSFFGADGEAPGADHLALHVKQTRVGSVLIMEILCY